ncbi:MAG TPA: VOC family protein [Candidatus Solibacter sp.]|jgi:catechol 2,3-dioxygenase-like lactoylglutathione lyase family enzyme|nr:VOC family protein [Candidatus Solibacter sp.]
MPDLVTGLAEVVVWSHDLEASLAFYRDLLGLTQMEQRPEVRPRFLKAADSVSGVPQMVVLVPHPDPDRAFSSQKADRTLHHMAFSVAAARYDDLESACRAAGLEVRGGVHPVLENVRTFYIDDPDGNEVEIIGPIG